METSPFKNQIKLFCDGANREEMLGFNRDPMIAGMTTNPSLMKKAGVEDFESFCKDILQEIKSKPLSFEVFADDLAEMKRQALKISTWGENVYTKIPVLNTKGESTSELIRELAHQGVKLNVTAVFTQNQIDETIEALKGGAPSFLSIFAGRIADTGRDPCPLMKGAVEQCRDADPNIEVLWASCREVYNIVQAEETGCPIITVPGGILKKLKSFLNRDLFEMSVDTVKAFKKDSDAAGYSLS